MQTNTFEQNQVALYLFNSIDCKKITKIDKSIENLTFL